MMKLRRTYGNMEDEMPTVERKKKSVHALLGTPRLKLDYMMLMCKRGGKA